MKEINLREFYPEIYKTDLFISLPDEVVDVLVEYQRKEVAYRRRTYRHKAFLSLDYGDDIEREAVLFYPNAAGDRRKAPGGRTAVPGDFFIARETTPACVRSLYSRHYPDGYCQDGRCFSPCCP